MSFARTGSGSTPGRDERAVRRDFWPKLRRAAAQIPFARELLAAYYCAFDGATPRHVQLSLIGALAYFVMPVDAIPDFIPVLGFGDDAAVIAATLKLVSAHVTPAHRDAATRKLDELRASD